MTNEPVAYWHIPQIKNEEIFVSFSPSKTSHFEDIPLYTSEDLHPRVKMTQAEFDEFKKLLSVGISTIYEAFDVIDSDRGEMDEFEQLYNRLFTNGVNEQAKQQIEFAKLWDSLSTCSAEEMIEIVPDMKWFVRSKEKYEADVVQGLPESGYLYLTDGGDYSIEYCEMTTFKDDATQFDTKEEAEKWLNPLTEAVRLSVEEE